MRIQHNIMAMNAYRNYTNNVSAMKKNLEKLSSGYKINRAGDDAAGLAISEKMRAQITGLETAQKNAKDGISLVQTAEGALTEVHDMLNRMVELATQSANGTYDNDTDRYQLQKEVNQLRSEIDRIADSSNFNGIKLLDGSMSSEATGAISNIQTSKFVKASDTPEAFKTSYVRNRPATAASGSKATFVVNMDDIKFSGTGSGAKITLRVGGQEIKATASGNATAFTASKVAAALVKGGTGKWDATNAKFTTGTVGTDANAIQINGHTFTMTVEGNTNIKFTQVDSIPVGAEGIYPDFKVETALTAGAAGNKATGDVNWQVQLPTVGNPDQTTHQARADLEIDFTKLKDGDEFIVGSSSASQKTFSFKTETNSKAAPTNGNTVQIDLSKYDLTDATDQKKAMLDIVKAMGDTLTSATATKVAWTVGNEGVSKNVGTISFQSLSNTTEDLATEEKVMAEFSGTSPMQNASTSFEIDVSKLEVGDTLKVGDTTFEFLETGTAVSDANNKAIYVTGLKDGLLAKDTATVTAAIKTAISAEMYGDGSTAKYDVAVDGNKVTITSKDLTATTEAENQVAPKVSATGSGSGGLILQIGDTADSYNQLRVSIGDAHVKALGLDEINIQNQDDALAAIDTIKAAINQVSDIRGTLGATQNRLDHTINNLGVMTENIQDAESTIRDTDVASEMMAYTKNNILIQSAQAMLAQANQVPQGVLQLLQ